MPFYKIIIIDGHQEFRTYLKVFLEDSLNHKVIAEANDGDGFLKLDNIRQVDIVLIDIRTPWNEGYNITLEATHRYPNLKVIAICGYNELPDVSSILKAGFRGCVSKDNIYEEIGPAMEEVMNNQYYLTTKIR